jgi:toxin CcdB
MVERICSQEWTAACQTSDVLVARFDVFKMGQGTFVVECQSDFLSHLQTRFVIPLLPPQVEPKVAVRLNPTFEIDGELYTLYPQFAASVPQRDLKHFVKSIADGHAEIIGALDFLTSGF